jgi:two-component system phosphate regulon response regulator PhoB
MEKIRILVVEDEVPIQELLQYNLERKKYRVKVVDSGEEALRQAGQFMPALILLDIMLPGAEGLEVCRQLKADPETNHIPVIMLTALSEEADIVTGLELGADDYITKPFSPQVLLARVKAALRRISTAQPVSNSDGRILIHGISVDATRHKVEVDGNAVTLTFTEFKVLQLMAGQPAVFSPATRSLMRSMATTTRSRTVPSTSRLSACARSWVRRDNSLKPFAASATASRKKNEEEAPILVAPPFLLDIDRRGDPGGGAVCLPLDVTPLFSISGD